MTVHYCTANPCPVCYRSATGPTASSSIVRYDWQGNPIHRETWASGGTGTLRMVARFYTWAEALAFALDAANYHTERPRIAREGDRWCVRYVPRLYLVNGA